MIKKFITFFLLVFLTNTSLFAKFDIKASTAILQDYHSGEILFDGEIMNINQIEQNARNHVQEFQMTHPPGSDGKLKQPIFVVITDKKAQYQIFLKVLDQLKLAECKKISVVES